MGKGVGEGGGKGVGEGLGENACVDRCRNHLGEVVRVTVKYFVRPLLSLEVVDSQDATPAGHLTEHLGGEEG